MTVRLGIELLDGARPIGRFAVPSEISSGPFTIGRDGQVQVPGNDVLPVHGVMLFQDGRLFCASASSDAPIRAGNQVVPTDWVELPIPCVLRIGARVAMRPFAYDAGPAVNSVMTPPPQALPQAGPRDATRVGAPMAARPSEPNGTPAARLAAAQALRAQAGQPVRQTVLAPKRSKQPTQATLAENDDTLMEKAKRRLTEDWRRTSKLMKAATAALPLVALLLMAKPSSATASLPAETPSALKAQLTMDAPAMDPAQAQMQMQMPGQPVPQAQFTQPITQPGFGTSSGRRALLTPAERQSQKRAVDFTFAGDFAGALAIYQSLSQAHPDDLELRTASNVIAQKSQAHR